MTYQIYIQTTETVTPAGRHLAIWLVDGANTIILNALSSGSFDIPVNTPQDPTWGNIIIEKIIVADIPSIIEIETYNLNLVDLSSQGALDASTAILNYYDTLGASFIFEGRSFIDTNIGYNPLGPNSNSVANSLLTAAEINLSSLPLYEDGDDWKAHYPPAFHPGHNHLLDTAGNTVLQGFSTDEDTHFWLKSGGDDTVYGGASTNQVRYDTSDGHDTVHYQSDGGITLSVHESARFAVDGYDGEDILHSIEKVALEAFNTDNTLDYSNFGTSIKIDSFSLASRLLEPGDARTAVTVTEGAGQNFEAINFGTFIATDYNDVIRMRGWGVTEPVWVDAGAGDDHIDVRVIDAIIDAGAGNDRIEAAAAGTIIYTGSGADVVEFADHILVADASGVDRIEYMFWNLSGAGKSYSSENPWSEWSRGVKYGINTQGDLVIRDLLGHQMFVSNYQSTLNGAAENTAGILLYEYDVSAHLFFREQPETVHHSLAGNFKLMDMKLQAALGDQYAGGAVDPLVVDLDGDGIEAVGDSPINPYFDMNEDGFAERSGWLRGGDAFLVQDQNENGKIDDIGEMFGAPGVDGYTELATLDTNMDGKIDESDSAWGSLRLWRDTNFNGITDEGELLTLESQDIVSFNVAPTVTTPDQQNGYTITETGTFTRGDSSTGMTGNVVYLNNSFHTKWLTDVAITPAAEALPDLEGHGTLPGLRVAMSYDTNFEAIVEAALLNLATHDLVALRTAAMPIFVGWMDAIPVASGAPGTVGRDDLAVLIKTSVQSGTEVLDYAIKRTDGEGTYWVRASGNPVLDEGGNAISRPTFAQIMGSSPSNADGWAVLDGDLINFMERWIGQHLPLGNDTPSSLAARQATISLINMAWTEVNRLTVALAAQSDDALKDIFDGIAYAPDEGKFQPVTDAQLVPFLEAILDGAPAGTAAAYEYLTGWKPLLDVVINNLDRGNSGPPTFGYLFQNLVAAYENVGFDGGIIQAASALEIPTGSIYHGEGAIQGSTSADIFYLDAGDEVVTGSSGADNYIIGRNFGTDTIIDVDYTLGEDNLDIVRFAHAKEADIIATRDGNDLILSVDGTTDSVRIVDQFAVRPPALLGGYAIWAKGVGQIVFADGVIWDRVDMAYAVSHPDSEGTTLIGTGQTDVLDGGAGNDRLEGGDESDIYVFGTGYGNDVINDRPDYVLIQSIDYVSFNPGTILDNLTFSRDGDSEDLVISIYGTDDTLTIEDQFNASYDITIFGKEWFNRIEVFAFSDGEKLYWDDLFQIILDNNSTNGNDTIYGFSRDDILDGGAGDDFLSGGNEDDSYVFGHGYGHDTISEDQTDLVVSSLDTLHFLPGVTPGEVILSRDSDSNHLVITLGDESTITILNQFQVFNTVILGVQAFNRIEYFVFADEEETVWTYEDIIESLITQSATDNDDVIYGFKREDVFLATEGNDFIAGGEEGDTYHWGRGFGSDIIYDLSGSTITLGSNIDKIIMASDVGPDDVQILVGNEGDDLILKILDTGETLTIKDQNMRFALGAAYTEIEQVIFADETVWTPSLMRTMYLENAGTSGNDIIYGFSNNNVIDGGPGDDQMYGGGGADTYTFGPGSGNDIIEDYIQNVFWDYPDKILFDSALSSSDVIFTKIGSDLLIELDGYADTLMVKKFFNSTGYYAIEQFQFHSQTLSFGDVYTLAVGSAHLVGSESGETLSGTLGNDTIRAMGGNDTLYGHAGDDWLDGGEGGDILYGGDGSDSYVASPGADIIHETDDSSVNEIHFGPGITIDDLDIHRQYDFPYTHLIINWGDGNQIKVDGHFYGGAPIDLIRFDDDSTYSLITERMLTKGTSGNDALTGINTGGTFNPDDILLGFEGDDVLLGSGGDDLLDGGSGNDALEGGHGNDSYSASSGHDVIEEIGGVDEIVFGEGISLEDLTFRKIYDFPYTHLEIFWGEENQMTIHGFFYAERYIVETIRFFDGTIYDLKTSSLLQHGSSEDDVLSGITTNSFGLNPNDLIYGFDGNDTIAGNGGDDTIYGGIGSDVIDGNTGDDSLHGDAGNDTLYGDDNNDIIYGGDGDDWIDGGDENDTVYGGAGNDTIYGDEGYSETGADYLYGDDGDDVIYGNNGGDFIYGGNGNDTAYGGAGQDNIEGNDGDDLLSGDGGNDVISGGAGNDNISGGSGNDLIYGGDGNDNINGGIDADMLYGGGGNDVIIGDNGNDQISGGDGDDIIDGGNNDDTIFAGAGNDTILGAAHADTIHGEDGDDDIDGGTGNDALYGGAGNDLLKGGSGDDIVYGGTGNDVLSGGSGADTLYGGDGNDIYIWGGSLGQDMVTDMSGDRDVILLADDSQPEQLTFSVVNSYDLRVAFSSSYRIDIVGQFDPNASGYIERMEFADGFWLDLTKYPEWVFGSSSGQTMHGDIGSIVTNDIIFGRAGNDTIYGYDGDDHLSGDAGNDIIRGDTGSDYIHGGSGADSLYGDDGNDFLFAGAGNDIAVYGGSGNDRIDGGSGNDGLYGDDGNDFLKGGTGDDVLYGGVGSDVLYGGDGADTLNGGDGDDLLYGGAGVDTMTGGNGVDKFVFELSSAFINIDTITDFNTSDGDALDLSSLLSAYDPLQHAIADYIQVTTTGSHSSLFIDADGLGSINGFTQIATLTDVTGLNVNDLLTNGNLVTA